jgi:hypothetical protein
MGGVPMKPSDTDTVLTEVFAERQRQLAKWGNQTHLEDGVSLGTAWRASSEEQCKNICEVAGELGTLSWELIFNEEVAEVLAAKTVEDRCAELVQLAAVCVAWVEAQRGRTK